MQGPNNIEHARRLVPFCEIYIDRIFVGDVLGVINITFLCLWKESWPLKSRKKPHSRGHIGHSSVSVNLIGALKGI